MPVQRFNELQILIDKCPRIFNGGAQRIHADEDCVACKRVKEIDFEKRLVGCGDTKINPKLDDF